MSSGKTMLCVVLLIASAILQVNCDVGKISSCCTRVSASKSKVPIVDFLIQNEDLPCVEAVVFITENGKILCSRHNLPWVTQKIKELMAKKAENNVN